MKFIDYVLESSLRKILKVVPQNSKHHSEGDVFTHTRMVRSRLPLALDFINKEKIKQDTIFSNVNTNLTKSEERILKLAAWFHDIGKASATQTDSETGKITAHGHESPKHYLPMLDKLSGSLKQLYEILTLEEKDILYFVIDNHMSLQVPHGFPRKIYDKIFDENGKIKNEPKAKLLIIFIIMDRTGRIKQSDFNPNVQTYQHKQEISKKNAHKELDDTLIHLNISKEKHLQRLDNIRKNNQKKL